MKFLLALLLCLCTISPAFAKSPATPKLNRLDIDTIVFSMLIPGVEVSVTTRACGEVNAYYTYSKKLVTICEELAAEGPAFVRFVVAHEMGHAIIHQLNIPYTGSEEVAADEVAAVFLGVSGRAQDVMAAGVRWLEKADPEDPFDDHPGDVRRGVTLICLAASPLNLAAPDYCEGKWDHAVISWVTLLGLR